MKKTLLALATTALLMGCGGGSSSDASPQGTTDKQATTYQKDGIYINDTDLVVMLVDSDMPLASVIIGDYVNNEILINDTHTINGNTMTTKGLNVVSDTINFYSQDVEATLTFNETGVTANTVLEGTNLIYSFDRTGDSLSLTDLAGYHHNPDDGSNWIFAVDGTFTVNGSCIFSGTLTRVDGYYSATNVTAANCADPIFNGVDYEARLVTVKQDGKFHILAVMANEENVLWGSAYVYDQNTCGELLRC
ncbi:hypothetical protein LZU85_14150 [Vibrio sp. IRLE0018]|uniref:hypothetical protein n=1 Tax=Vibrio floridensis TaxID=2908007 RepID=UPI001F2B3A81|nr:hypothetical protein [Vibrio floridensis]MCF8779944.1 hypothetical protein [Vibrio floridensis]